jgi:hypothetical protein
MTDTLNRFIEIKCNEKIDWLKIIRENFLDMSFTDLTKTCSKSPEVVEELRQVYIALMLREYQESSNEMKHVIHWELEKQFGRVPGNNPSLDAIEKEIATLKASRDYSDRRLKKSFPTSKTIVNKIMYMLSVNANPEEFIEKIQLDHECPVVIYNQFVRCCRGYSNANLPVTMEHNTCYWFFRQTWISCDEHQKITFELKRMKNNHDFLEGLNGWLKLQFPHMTITVDQNLYNGYFIVPHLRLNMISFLDHIFLNPQLQYIVYNEHNITSKLWYTLVVSLDDETSITFNISQKNVNANSKVTNHFGLEMCPLNSDYVKLNFNRIKDVVTVELVKAKLSKVFYYAQANSVVEAYTRIDPEIVFQSDEAGAVTDSETDDTTTTTGLINSNKMLKRLVPEIFLINYPRKCLHLPRLLKPHESKIGGMQFPIHGEPSTTRWYSCDHHEKAIFPGLRKNPLKNKASFPVIPCCYITDQELKIGSEFRKYYFNDIKSRKKNLKENVTYSTNRIVPVDVTGLLTKQLSFLFWAVHCKTFRRYGVDQSPRSVLHCLSLASGKGEPTVEWLVDNELYARQELDMIGGGVHPNWIDPAIYLRLLEYWYKFNIVLFENSRDVSNFVLLNPQRRYYTAFKPYAQTVYILINHGLDADDVSFPQCELLWYQNGNEVYHRQFVFNDSDMLALYDEYNGMQRVQPVENPVTQRVSLSGTCYHVNGRVCDPPHPPYFQVPEDGTNDPQNDGNVMFDYFEMLNTFQNQLLASLQQLEDDTVAAQGIVHPDIETFSRSMSVNSRRHILKKRRFFEMNLHQSRQQIFYSIQNYLTYCKFNTYQLLSHPKIFNNMILQCEPFDAEQLTTYVENNHSFHLYSFSLNNEHYFKEYEFKGGGGGEKDVIIEYDNTWFRHVQHDQSTQD